MVTWRECMNLGGVTQTSTSMKMPLSFLIQVLFCLLVWTAMPGSKVMAALPGMKVIKLASQGHTDFKHRRFGHAVAISDQFAVVSERGFSEMTPLAGAVHVFHAATGAFIRTLRPTDSALNDGFGFSLALHGSKLLVGAYQGFNGKGGAYLFDLTTGKQISHYPGPFLGSTMGYAVGLSEHYAVISAPEMNNQRGILFVFPLDGSPSVEFMDLTGNSQDKLGLAVRVVGRRIAASTQIGKILFLENTTPVGSISPVIGSALGGIGTNMVGHGLTYYMGAPLGNNGAINSGAVARFSFNEASTSLVPIDAIPSINRRVGKHLAVEGGLLAATADGFNGRGVVLHDLYRNQNLMTIDPFSLGTFATIDSIAMAGGRLLVGVPFEDYLAAESGAAYLVQGVPQPAPFDTVVSKGDQAPGFTGIQFGSLGDAAIMPSGPAVMQAKLTGAGSNRGKDTGMYSEAGHAGFFDSVAKSRQTYFGNVLFGKMGSPTANDPVYSIFPATLTGAGVTKANQSILLADSASGFVTLARAGNPLFPIPQLTIAKLGQAVQSITANRAALRLDFNLAEGVTTRENDSAVALQTYMGVNTELVREGADLGMNYRLGQIAPRVSFHSNAYFFPAALSVTDDPTFKRTGLMQKLPGGALTIFALTETPLPGSTDFKYAGFLGEGGSTANLCLKVSLKGPGITAANNEVILFDRGTGLTSVFQKNSSIIQRILRVWPLGNRLLAQVTLKGTGFNRSNNEALMLYQEDGSFIQLLQKGESLPGGGAARIGKIQRVETSSSLGHYAVLVSLTGVPGSSNQALLRGDVNLGMPITNLDLSLRRPQLVLRKGQSFVNGLAGSNRLTGLAFPHNGTFDATGVGRKGLASVVSGTGVVLLRATFADRSTRLIRVP
jgi:hypothetical protein